MYKRQIELQGVVIDPAESVDEVYVRTRYADGSVHPPIDERGVFHPGGDGAILGWAMKISWDGAGVGTFEGRARWFDAGTNFIDLYLPAGPWAARTTRPWSCTSRPP